MTGPGIVPELLEVDGRIVLIRNPDMGPPPEALVGMVHALRDAGAHLVIVCAPDSDIETFDEAEMTSAGWVSLARGGALEDWLLEKRDATVRDSSEWWELDRVLDEFRARADYGIGLTAPLPSFS